MSDEATCKDSLQVEAKRREIANYAPLSKEKRAAYVRILQGAHAPPPTRHTVFSYEATIRAVEVAEDHWHNERDEFADEIDGLRGDVKSVEAQRDVYKLIIVALARNQDLGPLLEDVRLYGCIEEDLEKYWDALVAELAEEASP